MRLEEKSGSLSRVAKLLTLGGWSIVFLAGVLLLSFGCWLAWHPGGYIVLGLLLAVTGFGGGSESASKDGAK